jgi:TonB family protein
MKIVLFCIASLIFNLGVGAQAPTSELEASSAVVVRFVAPPYPRVAKDNRMMGTTVSELSVALDGSVSGVRTIQAHKIFENAVTSALKQWHFKPQNQRYKLEVTVRFEFDDGRNCTNQSETLVSADLPNFVRVKTGLPCETVTNSEKKSK